MPEIEIKSLIYQCASPLAYMHKHGFFHRDLKPENILVNLQGVLKIIDFGLAREIRSRPPYTDYVATRWYRAPEILLQQNNYNSPVDIFALGCIMCELYLNRPMFSGTSEMDQLNKLLSVLGTFSQSEWPEGNRLAAQKGLTLAQFPPIQLSQIIPNASPDAINLINQMLRWDPNKRITATQMLQHPYFSNSISFLPTELSSPQNLQTQDLQTISSQHPPLSRNRQRQTNEASSLPHLQDNQERDNEEYKPSFGTINKKQHVKQDSFITPNRMNSSDKRKRSDSQRNNEESRDIDEMLDLVNQTTNGEQHPSSYTLQFQWQQQQQLQQRPIVQQPQESIGQLGSYQPSSFHNQQIKSALKFRNVPDYQDSSEYGAYVPSQITKKISNSSNSTYNAYGNGLQLPPQPNKVNYPNSIYNFDNVVLKPDTNARKQGGGQQINKQF